MSDRWPGSATLDIQQGGVAFHQEDDHLKGEGHEHQPGRPRVVGEMIALRSRLAKFSAQGYVNGERVFEGTIVGMKI